MTLKRVVFLTHDLSRIGGTSSRILRTINGASSRTVEYLCISAWNENGLDCAANIVWSEESDIPSTWSPLDTVFVLQNTVILSFPPSLQAKIASYPTIHMYAGQVAWFLQDSAKAGDAAFVRGYRATKLVAFSDSDIVVQRQFGIHGQIKLPPPIVTRKKTEYHYSPERNRYVGYVGRIDFHAKGAERLIGVAEAMRQAGLPPLRIFTTDKRNSPDFSAFVRLIEQHGLNEQFDIVLNCTDKESIYKELSVLLLPSKKESFGNVVLEAFSYGVPVISTSYAPGPMEVIRDGVSGFLLDDFDGGKVVELLQGLTPADLDKLSRAAFARHFDFDIVDYYDQLESIAVSAINDHRDGCSSQVYPSIISAIRWEAKEQKKFERQMKKQAPREKRSKRFVRIVQEAIGLRARERA